MVSGEEAYRMEQTILRTYVDNEINGYKQQDIKHKFLYLGELLDDIMGGNPNRYVRPDWFLDKLNTHCGNCGCVFYSL